ncbi:hypothetical protein KCM76_24610 [Zooshikella marina]|uniref:hypothetical protein n=1 Tax=Zooshikella ganghwensis TaxID=202772 RepID=UPI001BAEEC17|nr:hypothetical protein [Zooshikella ganghwensis]MBU2709201.1 hypothetical protein [Zooshikella ganghwensis]
MQLETIPQLYDSPITWDYLECKASMGSYKATDKLLSLLEFCSCVVLGRNSFEELSVDELKQRLIHEYEKISISDNLTRNPIKMAFRWAWPPIVGTRIDYESEELVLAVKALMSILGAQDPREIIKVIVESYLEDEDEPQNCAIYIGEDIKQLGLGRRLIEEALDGQSNQFVELVMTGYDRAEMRRTKGSN